MRHCRLVAKLPGHVGRYTWTVHDFKEAGPKYRLIIENIVKKKSIFAAISIIDGLQQRRKSLSLFFLTITESPLKTQFFNFAYLTGY